MPLLVCNCFLPYPQQVKKWNEIIKKQMQVGNAEQAILTYLKVQQFGFLADNYTFPVLLKAASKLSVASPIGFALHGLTIKTGFVDHVFVQTALVNMYGNLNCIDDALKVFDAMPVRDLVAWNSMLDAYVSNAEMDRAIELFNLMPLRDTLSFNTMISGFANAGEAVLAKEIFDQMVAKDVISWNSMISAYTRAGDVKKGLTLFGEMPVKNTISWNTILTGCLASQRFDAILDLFEEMKTTDCRPDYLTVTSVLSACAHLGSLETGIEMHIYALNNGLASSPHVTTALIDMYAKCGSIEQALHVFCKSQVKDVYCWNAVISALALHGQGYAALDTFSKMRRIQIRPDDITFIGLLNACSHSGLVQEGCQLFKLMQKDFGIYPKLEHYGCIVDMFGRSGNLYDAYQVIKAMPFEPGESIVGALLSACVIHQDVKIGKKAIDLITSRARCLGDGELMMFSNLYASCGNWEEANRWREMMNSTGIIKTAGYSEIEVNGRFHKFLAGEMSIHGANQ